MLLPKVFFFLGKDLFELEIGSIPRDAPKRPEPDPQRARAHAEHPNVRPNLVASFPYEHVVFT